MTQEISPSHKASNIDTASNRGKIILLLYKRLINQAEQALVI
jgi:hypothetical protein